MTTYTRSQDEKSDTRAAKLKSRQTFYVYDMSVGVPLSKFPNPLVDADGPEWVRKVLDVTVRIRANTKTYMATKPPFTFQNPYPPDILTKDFIAFAYAAITTSDPSWLQNIINTGSNIFGYALPDMGPGGNVTSIQQFKDLFQTIPLPEVANRFETDESFAWNFVAGPNPNVLERLESVPAEFPISNEQLRSVAEFQNDDLDQAMREGRIFVVDHSDMTALNNGLHYERLPKYIYAPWAAFAVPRGGGRLYPFAIQCGPTSQGRIIYNPTHNYSWKIAKNCMLAAHNVHHELVTHLGCTHYLMEPILLATRRQLSDRHPVYALLDHHTLGTMLINYGATHNLILETRSVDRLVGCDLPSAYAYMAKNRLGYSFRENYLKRRFERKQTSNRGLLPIYPYRDDGMRVWDKTEIWAVNFVQTFYKTDREVQQDQELQNWAAEIASPDFGRVRDFGDTPGSIRSQGDLIRILTMIMFTAGPQHAAVNFSQGTDMAFTPANPLMGFTPEPRGLEHNEQDWLNNLPPIETGITASDILPLLAGVNYTRYGHYYDDAEALLKNFDTGDIHNFAKKFIADLGEVEQEIVRENADTTKRLAPYLHLLPSRIPQSVNI